MARVARLDGTGAFHHVIVRGVERRAIFVDDVDRLDFLDRLRTQLTEGQGACFGWVLMDNHVHLLLRTGMRSLSSAMRRLNGGYARAFNLRHERSGYLFQGRFHSILVQDEAYLRELIRYVHLNPLRAGMVDSFAALGSYPWSGLPELLGRVGIGVLAVNELLQLFGETPEEGRNVLASWIEAGVRSTLAATLPERADRPQFPEPERGANDTARWEPSGVLETTVLESRANRLRSAGWTVDLLIDWVCRRLGANPVAVRNGRRTLRESRARAVIGVLGTRDLRLPLEQVARSTGVTSGPMSRAIERGIHLAEHDQMRLDDVPR
jgi:REP element-mobilizing transposase RayT